MIALAACVGWALVAAAPTEDRGALQDADEAMESARALLAKGETSGAKKRLGEAEEIYHKLLTRQPDDREAAVGLGSVYFLERRYDDGVKLLEPFHERFPDDADVTHQLGMNLYRAGQQAIAVPLLRKVADDPKRFDAAWILALHFYRQGEWDTGLPYAQHYQVARPDDVDALALIGTYYLKAGRFDDAVKALDAYLAAHPDNVAARINRANALFRAGQVDQAGHEYEKLLSEFPDRSRFLYNLAAVRMKQGRCADALPLLEKFLKHEPKNGPGLYFRADCLLALGRSEDAKAAFDAAGTQGPSNPWVYYGLSRLALHDHDLPAAIANAVRAAGLAPDEPELAAWQGTVYRKAQRPADALTAHERALQLAPDEPTYHVERGRDLWALERVDDALAAFTKASALAATTPGAAAGIAAAETALGVKAFQAGDAPGAEAHFQRALAASPVDPTARADLALLEVATGRVDAAVGTLAAAPVAAVENGDVLAVTALVRVMQDDVDGAAQAVVAAHSAGTVLTAIVAEVDGQVAARRGQWDQAAKAFDEAATLLPSSALEQAKAQAWLELGLERLGRGDGAARDALARVSRAGVPLDAEDKATLDFALLALAVVTADNGAQAAKSLAAALGSARFAGATWAHVRDVGWGYVAYGHLAAHDAAEARAALARVRDPAGLGAAYDALASAADDIEARRAYERGDYASAEKIWAAMTARASDPAVVTNLAAARFMLGRSAEAEAAWRPLAAAGAPPEAAFDLANALARRGEHKAAWDLFRAYADSGGADAARVRERIEVQAKLFGFGVAP